MDTRSLLRQEKLNLYYRKIEYFSNRLRFPLIEAL